MVLFIAAHFYIVARLPKIKTITEVGPALRKQQLKQIAFSEIIILLKERCNHHYQFLYTLLNFYSENQKQFKLMVELFFSHTKAGDIS